jgi:hypothetical protein
MTTPWAILIVGFLFVAVFAWLSRFDYRTEKQGQFNYTVRIDNFSGEQCIDRAPKGLMDIASGLSGIPQCKK